MSVVDRVWDEEIVPALTEFIRIPNLSPAFDPEWAAHGHMAEAADLVRRWCEGRGIAGATVDLMELPGLTPVLVIDVPASGGGPADDTVVLYGHLDKQPEMTGWREGLGPWTPVLEGDRLYGRGGADDGYAAFAALTAIEAVRDAGRPHARCVVLIEGSEESGSTHLPPYIDALGDRIGDPSLVVCLDSSCPTWDRLWLVTSLRGMVIQNLTVEVLTEGVHSGLAGGIVPDSFRLLRSLLARIEDDETGELLVPELRVDVPGHRLAEVEATAAELGSSIADWPFVPGAGPAGEDPAAWLLSKSWKASLAVTGVDGMPPVLGGGNVIRPFTRVRLAFRVPPTADAAAAARSVEAILTADPPHGARVTVDGLAGEDGWNAQPMPPWLAEAVDRASVEAYGQPARSIGEGGTIPFIGMLASRFPEAQFVITGVLGPGSNAHGPNEFLDVPTGKRVTQAVASILAAHAARSR
jgi:acetylornithine deacetylase/succinyl-diaminopimelate desuccinylase-like protein